MSFIYKGYKGDKIYKDDDAVVYAVTKYGEFIIHTTSIAAAVQYIDEEAAK